MKNNKIQVPIIISNIHEKENKSEIFTIIHKDQSDKSLQVLGEIIFKDSNEDDYPITEFDQYLVRLMELEQLTNFGSPDDFESIYSIKGTQTSQYRFPFPENIFLLTTIIKGNCKFVSCLEGDMSSFYLKEGDMVLYNPYITNLFHVSDGTTCEVFHLQVSLV